MWSSADRSRGWLVVPLAVLTLSVSHAAKLQVAVADPSGRPLADAVVYATRVDDSPASPVRSPQATIDQVNKTFVPLVSVIRTGTEVRFPNSDNVRHSIYSFSPPKVFTEKLYSGTEAPPVVFDKPGLVVLGCNIHDQMLAWVVVVDTPYFGKTSANGLVELKELPVGDYELRAWYPAPTFEPKVQAIHVGNAVPSARVSIVLDTAGPPLPALENSGAGH
jgi:plastocyanin